MTASKMVDRFFFMVSYAIQNMLKQRMYFFVKDVPLRLQNF